MFSNGEHQHKLTHLFTRALVLGRRAEGLPESIAFSREVESDTNTGVKGLDKDLGDKRRGGMGESKLISRLQVNKHEWLV